MEQYVRDAPIDAAGFNSAFQDPFKAALQNFELMRRHGIAQRMMKAIEGVAAQQNMPRIILEVRPSNTNALKLYEKMGLETRF